MPHVFEATACDGTDGVLFVGLVVRVEKKAILPDGSPPTTALSPPQANTLLPDMSTHLPQDTMRAQSNRSFFKRELTIFDSFNCPHTVTYECLVSSGQRHARLSAGWGTLMRRLNAKLGDTVVLAQHGDRNDCVLRVAVERGVA